MIRFTVPLHVFPFFLIASASRNSNAAPFWVRNSDTVEMVLVEPVVLEFIIYSLDFPQIVDQTQQMSSPNQIGLTTNF